MKVGSVMAMLSNDATPITFLPTPGAPAVYRPSAPLLPIDATTATPLLTSRSEACAVGYCGHWYDEPMLMLSTFIPSASTRSIAASMMSASVEPWQPKTRYEPKVTPGATPLTAPFAPTMPATWVPCPAQSSGRASGCGTGS